MLPGFQTSDLHNAINLGSQGKCRQGSHEWVTGGVKKLYKKEISLSPLWMVCACMRVQPYW